MPPAVSNPLASRRSSQDLVKLDHQSGEPGGTVKISVFGLGYVGCVSAACLTAAGQDVFGVDIDTRKVNEVNEGNAPFFEPGLGPLLLQGRQSGTLTATTNEADAIRATEMALVCVGTPSVQRTGEIGL